MSYRLLKYGLEKDYSEPRMFRSPERLRDSYEVVIIGGGGHGLAAAHYLAHEHGIRDVAVLGSSATSATAARVETRRSSVRIT